MKTDINVKTNHQVSRVHVNSIQISWQADKLYQVVLRPSLFFFFNAQFGV